MKSISIEEVNLTGCMVALGKFEGIHKGHQLLLQHAVDAGDANHPSVAFTIDMPDTLRIYTAQERDALLEQMGIAYKVYCNFTKEFASHTPEEFVRDILVKKLHPSKVIVGRDFRFGANRAGDVEILKALGRKYGFMVCAFEKLSCGDDVISSTRVRAFLQEGKVEKIEAYLGRFYSVEGVVQQGKKLGRTIGFPTANILPTQEKLLPPNGVYETKITIGDRRYRAITNVGVNPTVDCDNSKKIESHILEWDGNLYGKKIKVEFVRFVRKERKFDSIEDLKNQIEFDTIGVAHQ